MLKHHHLHLFPKELMTLNAQKGHHTCFFAGLVFRNYRSFRSGQLLEMLSQAATQTPLVIEQKNMKSESDGCASVEWFKFPVNKSQVPL